MRLVPIRLSDVPLAVRQAAAGRCARDITDWDEGVDLIAAAIAPSDRLYWVPAKAAERLGIESAGNGATVPVSRTGVRERGLSAAAETLPTDPGNA